MSQRLLAMHSLCLICADLTFLNPQVPLLPLLAAALLLALHLPLMLQPQPPWIQQVPGLLPVAHSNVLLLLLQARCCCSLERGTRQQALQAAVLEGRCRFQALVSGHCEYSSGKEAPRLCPQAIMTCHIARLKATASAAACAALR